MMEQHFGIIQCYTEVGVCYLHDFAFNPGFVALIYFAIACFFLTLVVSIILSLTRRGDVISSMFHYPRFMSRRKKVEALEGMIAAIDKAGKKPRCDICKRKFVKGMTRWSKRDFTSSICILCHKKYFDMKISDYVMPHERAEIRRLKERKKK